MALVSRHFLVAAVLWTGITFAESNVSPPAQGSPVLGAQGLLLTLSRGQAGESPDATSLKDCLVDHFPTACELLTLELKNEGKVTILSWFGTCNEGSIGFALLIQDGNWKPLPAQSWSCVSDMQGEQSLPPGKSYIRHVRLADRALQISDTGYALLAGKGPFTIRASWTIWGCVASRDLKAESTPDPVTAKLLCAKGTAPKHAFAVARSNALTLTTKPLLP